MRYLAAGAFIFPLAGLVSLAQTKADGLPSAPKVERSTREIASLGEQLRHELKEKVKEKIRDEAIAAPFKALGNETINLIVDIVQEDTAFGRVLKAATSSTELNPTPDSEEIRGIKSRADACKASAPKLLTAVEKGYKELLATQKKLLNRQEVLEKKRKELVEDRTKLTKERDEIFKGYTLPSIAAGVVGAVEAKISKLQGERAKPMSLMDAEFKVSNYCRDQVVILHDAYQSSLQSAYDSRSPDSADAKVIGSYLTALKRYDFPPITNEFVAAMRTTLPRGSKITFNDTMKAWNSSRENYLIWFQRYSESQQKIKKYFDECHALDIEIQKAEVQRNKNIKAKQDAVMKRKDITPWLKKKKEFDDKVDAWTKDVAKFHEDVDKWDERMQRLKTVAVGMSVCISHLREDNQAAEADKLAARLREMLQADE